MELINWIWFAGAIASAATLGIADGKARNIQPIEALWLALLWVRDVACCNAIWSQLAQSGHSLRCNAMSAFGGKAMNVAFLR